MAVEIFGLSAIKTAYDKAKELLNIHDTVAHDRAVIDLQKQILAAQEAQFAWPSLKHGVPTRNGTS
jgi:hypothetical protein